MEMRRGLVYMLLGAGISAGVQAVYHQYMNGNITNTFNNMKNAAENQLEDMM